MTDGEVAIRQDGHEHAVAADVDGEIVVDLDGQEVVEVPTEVGVIYHDDQEDGDDAVLADGGTQQRTEVDMRGFGLSDELTNGTLVLGAVLLVSSGAMLGSTASSDMIGAVALAAGALLGWIGLRSAGAEL